MSGVVAGLMLLAMTATLENVSARQLGGNRVLAKKKVPAVGGYSNSFSKESATVGIITRMHGVSFTTTNGELDVASVGSGISKNTLFYVEKNAVLEITDLENNAHLFIGPAVAKLTSIGNARLFKGWLWQHVSTEGSQVHFETNYLSGASKGKHLVLATPHQTQLYSIEDESLAWHPMVKETAVLVGEGMFTENSADKPYLHPEEPAVPEQKQILAVLSFFGEQYAPDPMRSGFKGLASIEHAPHKFVFRGSRPQTQLVEVKSSEAEARLMARLKGVEFKEESDADIEAAGHEVPRKFSSRKRGRYLSSKEIKDVDPSKLRRRWYIRQKGKKLTKEQLELLNRLEKRH